MVRVFISYSHDTANHLDLVLFLSNRLRSEGVDCRIDQYEESPPEGWPTWCGNQVEEANFVLVVCTASYERRFQGKEQAGQGLGASWEGFVITQELYEALRKNIKFIPVVLQSADASHIPIILRAATRYDLSSEDRYDALYRRLTNQPEIVMPELGEIQQKSPRAMEGALPELTRRQDFRESIVKIIGKKRQTLTSGLIASIIFLVIFVFYAVWRAGPATDPLRASLWSGVPRKQKIGVVSFTEPKDGWLQQWGDTPPNFIYGITPGTDLGPAKGQYRFVLAARIENPTVDQNEDTAIVKSTAYSVENEYTKLAIPVSQDFLKRVAPASMVYVSLLLLPNTVQPEQIHKLSDVEKLGGGILRTNAFLYKTATITVPIVPQAQPQLQPAQRAPTSTPATTPPSQAAPPKKKQRSQSPNTQHVKGADLSSINAAQTQYQFPGAVPAAPSACSSANENQPQAATVTSRESAPAISSIADSSGNLNEKHDAGGPASAAQTAKADGPSGGDVARDRPLTRNEILAEIKVALEKDRESDEMRGCHAGKSVELRTVGDDISYYVCVQQCFARWNTASLKDLDFGGIKVSQPYNDPNLAVVEIPCLQKGSLTLCTKTSEGTFVTAECIKKKLKDDYRQSFVMVMHVENVESLLRLWKSFALTPP